MYDGDSDQAAILGKFCGSSIPIVPISSSHEVLLRLSTDTHTVRQGVLGRFQEPADICSINNLNRASGSFQSPNYPGNYVDNLQCDVIISVTPGKLVQITFDFFDVEYHSRCNYDFLEVRYGLD